MKFVKLFFLNVLVFLFVFVPSSIAQINGINIVVFNQSESSSIVKIENTSNGLKNLIIESNGYFVSNEFDLNLLTQTEVQEDLVTILGYKNDLRTIIHQDDLLRTIIHQDNLLRTIIHQDDLLRVITPFFQEHGFTPPEKSTIIRLFTFLNKKLDLFNSIINILDLENGAELLDDLLTIEPEVLIEESVKLESQASENYEFSNSEGAYALVQVRVTNSSNGKGLSILVFH